MNNIFFTPQNKGQIKIGDYYYKDGTLSHEYQKEKECIGIVFSISGTFKFPNGSVVALKDAKNADENNLHLWRNTQDRADNELVNKKNKEIENRKEELKTDYNGFFYCEHITDEEYVAINIAKSFPVELSKEKTSGWYLPSSGQMYQITHRFVNNKNFEEQESILNLADIYMVSQAQEAVCPLCLNLIEKEYRHGKAEETFLIRPVFSF